MNTKTWYDQRLDQIFFATFEDNLLSLDLPDGVHLTFDFKNGAINKIEEIRHFFEHSINLGLL